MKYFSFVPSYPKKRSSDSSENLQLIMRMLRLMSPVWKTAVVAGLIIIVRALIEVLCVYFISPAVTTVVTQMKSGYPEGSFWDWIVGDSLSAVELRGTLLWMASAQFVLGIMIYLRSVYDVMFSMRAVYHMRAAVYDRLQRANLSFHDKMSSGELINRAINDLQSVRHFVNMSLLGTLDIVASLAFYLGLLCMRSPWLMLAALVPVPLWCLVIFRFSKKAQPLCQKQQEANDRLMSALSENLSGVHVVRAFATEKQEIAKYDRLNGRLLKHLLKTVRLQATLTPSLKLIATMSHISLFVLSAWLIGQRGMAVGDLMLLGAAMGAILSKLQQINAIVEAYQKAIVSSRRLFEIMDLPYAVSPDGVVDAQKQPLVLTRGEIVFENVSFNYGRKPALDHVTTRIPGARVTALVGPTGAGKTTFVGLIGRFYNPDQGQIRIDGQDILTVDPKDIRRRIGYVFQETFLFSNTIRDNIRYGRMDVSDEMVKRAAQIAHADEFIEKLPNGYDTLIGERGVNLSGGQRQRLALARALVYDPEILILDDATAALDATTEEVIHERLDSVFKGRTVLLIANRLASVEGADYVLVMERGRITDAGTHEELINRDGHYREIIRMQMMVEDGTALATGTA